MTSQTESSRAAGWVSVGVSVGGAEQDSTAQTTTTAGQTRESEGIEIAVVWGHFNL